MLSSEPIERDKEILYCLSLNLKRAFPAGSLVKNPPAGAGDIRDMGSFLGPEVSPEGRNGKTL